MQSQRTPASISTGSTDRALTHEHAALYRSNSREFAAWAAGFGVIRHGEDTQTRVHQLVDLLATRNHLAPAKIFELLTAADRLASAGMWMVAHMTYAARVRLDGAPLTHGDMKPRPEGHTGGALNIVPAYVGYLLANALTGTTRGWVMGQGHCVAAVDATNVLIGNTSHEHGKRYAVTDEGLSRMAGDFYSYALDANGVPASPLGSHVNANTAGGVMEGGYLGFAELTYVHMPLPGESLVAFLSDGAFEEQRGSDWAPRYWRAEDSGLVTPIMIANGRRIDQRTTMNQEGGPTWLSEHLAINGFDPVIIDGRDPAAFAWAIIDAEERLAAAGHAVSAGDSSYPVRLPYVIAETEKGYGFPGAGTNRAHNLPLHGNPHDDPEALGEFNAGARALWVPRADIAAAATVLNNHAEQHRRRELAHPMASRDPVDVSMDAPLWRCHGDPPASAMAGIDATFSSFVVRNPGLRPRVGNPDEMESNCMRETLVRLRHRVCEAEVGAPEAIDGGVITALNEEAVVCAALGNKAGINLVVSYEAFAVKMLGALRQEIIFARHQREAGCEPRWLSVPVISTSHLWENGKNEQSHQDPTLCEALMQEMSDSARVVFPADWNTAVEALRHAYRQRGRIWNLVVAKRPLAHVFHGEEACRLAGDGAVHVCGEREARVQLVAVGAYQLEEARRAATVLENAGIDCMVTYLQEPGRFRVPRDATEARFVADQGQRNAMFPEDTGARVFLVHGHPEAFAGVLRAVDLGPKRTAFLGYANRGGTLDTPGLLQANGCTWKHAVRAVAGMLGTDADVLLRGIAEPPNPRPRPTPRLTAL